jgi:hypothetical protein
MSAQPSASPAASGGSGTQAFVIAMGFVLATITGAGLSAAGSGAFRDAGRLFGFDSKIDLEAAQRQQAAAIARLHNRLGTVMADIESLKARDRAAETALADHLVRVDGDLARLHAETAELRTTRDLTVVGIDAIHESLQQQVDGLTGRLTQADVAIDALRASLDDRDAGHRLAAGEMGLRIDRLDGDAAGQRQTIGELGHRVQALEQHSPSKTGVKRPDVAATEITGSLADLAPRRGAARVLAGWRVEKANTGGATVIGPRGSFDVARGATIPGLGRVASVRQRSNRWVVVTDRGVIVERPR